MANRFTVIDTYELIEGEDDMRASFDYADAVYVMTNAGMRLARLVKRVVTNPEDDKDSPH